MTRTTETGKVLQLDPDWQYEPAGPYHALTLDENDNPVWSNSPYGPASELIKQWAHNLLERYPDRKLDHFDFITQQKMNLRSKLSRLATAMFLANGAIPRYRSPADTVANALKVLGPKAVTECIPSQARRREVIDVWAKNIDEWEQQNNSYFKDATQENREYYGVLPKLDKNDVLAMLEQATLHSRPIDPAILAGKKRDKEDWAHWQQLKTSFEPR